MHSEGVRNLDLLKEIKNISIEYKLLGLFMFLVPIELFLIGSFGTMMKYYQLLCIIWMLFRGQHAVNRLSSSVKIMIYEFCMWLFLLIMSISLLWSYVPKRGFGYIVSFGLQIVFVSVVIRQLKSEDKTDFLAKTYLAGCVVLSIMMFFNAQKVGSFVDRMSVATSEDSVIDPNNIASILVIAVLYAMNIYTKNIWMNLIRIMSISVISVAILMTSSRGAMVALLFGLMYSAIKRKNAKKSVQYLIAITIVASIVYVVNTEYLSINFINGIIERFISDDSGSGRIEIWQAALRSILKRPVIGYGIGSSPYVIAQHGGSTIGSHNTFLTLLMDGGILVFFPFLTMLWKIFKNIKGIVFENMCVSGLIASIVCCFFIDAYNKKILWVPILMCCISIASKFTQSCSNQGTVIK